MYVWESEFPVIKAIKRPKSLFANTIIRIDRLIKRLVFFGTIILMIYLSGNKISAYVNTGDLSNLRLLYPSDYSLLLIYKAYRNLFYFFLIWDMLFVIGTCIVYILRRQLASCAKTALNYLLLLFFVTFSYAIAGIVLDLLVFIIIINLSILKNVRLPVNLPVLE